MVFIFGVYGVWSLSFYTTPEMYEDNNSYDHICTNLSKRTVNILEKYQSSEH